MHRLPLPPGTSWYSFREAESTPGTWTCPMPQKKSPVTQPGIDTGTFGLVVQRLNHYATPGPCVFGIIYKKSQHKYSTPVYHINAVDTMRCLWRYTHTHTHTYIYIYIHIYIYINSTIIPPIMIINRIYEHKIFRRCSLFPSWLG
jgi:hypothetical protein